MQNLFPAGKIFLFLIFLMAILPARSQDKDSLWSVWNDLTRPDSVRLDAVDHISLIHTCNSDADSALMMADLEYDFAKKVKREKNVIRALLRKAEAHGLKNDRMKAHRYYELGLRLSRKENYETGMAVSLNNLGTNYLNWGDYTKAIHFFYEAFKIVEKKNDLSHISAALCNIAEIYTKIGRYDSSIRILKRAENICKNMADKRSLASTFRVLSNTYLAAKETDSALSYFEKVVAIRTEINDLAKLRYTNFDIASVYIEKGNYVKAAAYTEKSMAISRKLSDTLMIGKCIAQSAIINHCEGRLDQALLKITAAYEISKRHYDPRLKLELLKYLAAWHKEKGNYKKSLEMNEQYAELNDSLDDLNSKSALYLEQLKYDSEKKELIAKNQVEKKLSLIKTQNEEKDLRKNTWLLVTGFLLLTLTISSWFIFHHFKQKNIITLQKNNILKQQLLVSQMNPHFIFNSLNAIQNFIFRHDSYNAGIYLKQFSELIRRILDFSMKDLISLEEECDFLQNYLELQKLRFKNKLNYELIIAPELDRDMVMVPPMLAQPFIENAIEHGIFYKNGEGFLSVKISSKGDTLLYEIEDNGIGLMEALKLRKEQKGKHRSLAIEITRQRIEAFNRENRTNVEIEIKDKGLYEKEASGVYVKFATPFLTL